MSGGLRRAGVCLRRLESPPGPARGCSRTPRSPGITRIPPTYTTEGGRVTWCLETARRVSFLQVRGVHSTRVGGGGPQHRGVGGSTVHTHMGIHTGTGCYAQREPQCHRPHSLNYHWLFSHRPPPRPSFKILNSGGAWVGPSVKHPTLAQVTISRFVGSSPASGPVLTAQSLPGILALHPPSK